MRHLFLLTILAAGSLASGQSPGNPAGPERGSTVETATPKGEQKGAGGEDKWVVWKWANFLILAAGLGYLIRKNAGPFFLARTERIQKDMVESGRLREEAEARAKEIEARLSALGAEIERLRTSARTEFASEGERIRAETERRLKRTQQQSEQEIALMSKSARDELQAFAAQLAVDLAEERIRSRMDHPAQSRLVEAFVTRLGDAPPEARQ